MVKLWFAVMRLSVETLFESGRRKEVCGGREGAIQRQSLFPFPCSVIFTHVCDFGLKIHRKVGTLLGPWFPWKPNVDTERNMHGEAVPFDASLNVLLARAKSCLLS